MGFKVYTAEIPARPCANGGAASSMCLPTSPSTQEGIDLLAKFKEIHPHTEIIMVSGQATVDSVVTAYEKAALVTHPQAV